MISIRSVTDVTTPGALLGHTKTGRPIRLQAGGSAPTGEPAAPPAPPAPPTGQPQQQPGQPPIAPPVFQPPMPAPPTTPPPAPAAQPPADPNAQVDISTLPPAVQKIITDLRAENAKTRTTAKTTAAEEAKLEIGKTIAQALGWVDPATPPDPAKLAAEVTANRAEAQVAKVQLAVFQRATSAGANPALLLDSASFLSATKGLDPAAADFGTQLDAAIKSAVEANPHFKAGQAPAAPAVGGTQMTPPPGATGQRAQGLGAAVSAAMRPPS